MVVQRERSALNAMATGRTPASTWPSCAGEVAGRSNVLTRVHSECWTSEVLGSLKCDCREQLDAALEKIAGRGHRRHRLPAPGGPRHRPGQQDPRLRPAEPRRRHRRGQPGSWASRPTRAATTSPARSCADLGVKSVRLMTNNPLKVNGLRAAGVAVAERVSHWVGENQHNAEYLAVKRRKMGHHPDTLARLRAPIGEPGQRTSTPPARRRTRNAPFPRPKMSAPSWPQVNDPALKIDFVTAGMVKDVDRRRRRACAMAIELTTPACPSRDVIEQVDPGGGGPAARASTAVEVRAQRRGAAPPDRQPEPAAARGEEHHRGGRRQGRRGQVDGGHQPGRRAAPSRRQGRASSTPTSTARRSRR